MYERYQDKTRTPVESRHSQVKIHACTLRFWREKSTEAVLALRATDTISSKMTWSVPGHQRWDTLSMSAGCLRSKEKTENERATKDKVFAVKSVTVSVVSVSAQQMIEDVNVCHACDSLKYLSHLQLCRPLGFCPESCSDRDPHAQLCHRQHPWTCPWERHVQVSPPLWSDSQQRCE